MASLRGVAGFARALATCMFLMFAGCGTTHEALRSTYADGDACSPAEACSDNLYYKVADKSDSANEIHLAFLEFDDQGYLQKDRYKDRIIERIRKMAETQPLLIVVYAHGWRNNVQSADVGKFAKMLTEVAARDHHTCHNSPCASREVVGVYLGWRGLSVDVEPFNTLSFWKRKSRAHRVGIDGATEVLAELAEIKTRVNKPDSGFPGRTRLVLTGHSFGAALMYSATQQLLMRDLVFRNDENVVPPNTADLIVLVNPAFEAARVHSLRLKASKESFDVNQRPILAVFTSKTDEDTGRLFPLGRGLSTLLMHHAPDRETTECCSEAHQRLENKTTIGKYEPWRTHDLTIADEDAKRAAKAAPERQTVKEPPLSESICGWQEFQSGQENEWNWGDMTLSRTERMQVDGQFQNPYMLVSVDDHIISKHSGIWTENFSKFLYSFIAVQNAKPGTPCKDKSRPTLDAAY